MFAWAWTPLMALMFYMYLHSSYIFFLETLTNLGYPGVEKPQLLLYIMLHISSFLELCRCVVPFPVTAGELAQLPAVGSDTDPSRQHLLCPWAS